LKDSNRIGTKRNTKNVVVLALLASAAASAEGCAVQPKEQTTSSQSSIINGWPGVQPGVGKVVINDAHLCTGTLVQPTLVLTAKHCALDSDGSRFLDKPGGVTFSFDGKNFLPFVDVSTAPTVDNGGAWGNASDVAIYRLASPITNVAPIAIATEEPSFADPVFLATGYGMVDHKGDYNGGNSGILTLYATSGAPLQKLFGSFEAYEAAVTKVAGAAYVQANTDYLRWDYDATLAPGYEVWLTSPAGSQVCHGDSGGPLLQYGDDGNLKIYGVVTGSTSYGSTYCYFGSLYSTFGPEAMRVLEQTGAVRP
jgi:hypothetical protein